MGAFLWLMVHLFFFSFSEYTRGSLREQVPLAFSQNGWYTLNASTTCFHQGRRKQMKIITLEEHFEIAEIKKAVARFLPDSHEQFYQPPTRQLEDLGVHRLAEMDAMGIDVQVLSHTSVDLSQIPAAEAIALARAINDQLAETVQNHPDRFVGFATLPTRDPEAAAHELERSVTVLGFKGAMIHGQTNNRFLDDPSFRPILETAAALDVPLYVHPAPPSRVIQDAYYAGFDPAVSACFATFGWGWHLDTGIHALRMILGGVFDRYPNLQLLLGHWGEMIPFYLARFAEALTPAASQLQRPVADYFVQQMYVTPSGMFTLPPFLLAMQVVGAERILYSVDYPFHFQEGGQARAFLENAPISPADKEKIAHSNAEGLLKLSSLYHSDVSK
jgi:predicted TIM-barrel fold metal-dependent hydrolase